MKTLTMKARANRTETPAASRPPETPAFLEHRRYAEKVSELRNGEQVARDAIEAARTKVNALQAKLVEVEIDIELENATAEDLTAVRREIQDAEERVRGLQSALPARKEAIRIAEERASAAWSQAAAEFRDWFNDAMGPLVKELAEHLAKASEVSERIRKLESEARSRNAPVQYGHTFRPVLPGNAVQTTPYSQWARAMRERGFEVSAHERPAS